MKNITLSIIVLAIVIFGSIMAYSYSQSNSLAGENSTEATVVSASTKAYFDDASPVMYFWSPLCSWCQKEELILSAIEKDGFRVKSMNVYEDKTLYDKFSIEGTPTFIAKNGERLVGYQDEVTLRTWLEKQGAKVK